MFKKCFQASDESIFLAHRDSTYHSHTNSPKTPIAHRVTEKLSLRSIKSLKSIKSFKTIEERPFSPRISLKFVSPDRKNIECKGSQSTSPATFRNPFVEFEGNATESRPFQTQQLFSQNSQKQLIHFQLEDKQVRPESYNLMEQSFVVPHIEIHCQERIEQQQLFDDSINPTLLSTIQQEKQDLKSTHFSNDRLGVQRSNIKPKSVVSMMSSRSDVDSVLLEKPAHFSRITSLF